MDRRAFLTLLAAGTASTLTGCRAVQAATGHAATTAAATRTNAAAPTVSSTPTAAALSTAPAEAARRTAAAARSADPTPPPASPVAYRPPVVLDQLPGSGNHLALTVDDGVSAEVVGAYTQFAKESGIRLTFFLNGVYTSWTEHAAALRPLVDSGQVQLANHTFTHPWITRLSDREIVSEVRRNETFIRNTFGVDPRPFFRPPYGAHTPRTDAILADLGYPDITMWWGSLGDSNPLTGDQILAEARTWFRQQRIVIGHANHPGVMGVYPQLLELIRARNLATVTLHDVFAGHS